MYCHKCGCRLDDDDIFCSNCGAKAKRPQKTQDEQPEVRSAQTNETVQPKDAGAVENAEAALSENHAESEIIVPDEIVVAEEKMNITKEDSAEDVAGPQEVLAEKSVDSEPVQNPIEEKREETSPTGELSFEFRPKEFEADEISSAQSALFQPIPDLIIADASENPGRKKKSGAVQAICSVLLSLFVFVFSGVLILQLFVRFGFTEDRLREAFNNVNYKEIKAGSILNLRTISEKYGIEIPEDATLAEAIYRIIDQRELVNPISLSEVERLIERLKFQEFIAEKSSKAVRILRSGSNEQPVYASEIIDFLKANEEEIERTIGIQILDVDYKYMQQYLEDHNDELLDILSEKNLTGADDSFEYTLIRFFCSDWFILVLFVMILFIAVAVGFINKRVSYSLIYTGTSIAAAGVLLLVCAVFYKYLLYRLSLYFPTEFIEQFAAPVIGVLTVISAVSAAVGVVMIVIGFILKSKEKRKRRMQLAKA